MVIRASYHTAGSLSLDFCVRGGIRTVKTRFFICWRSDRQLIRSRRLHGTRCGAIVIATNVTATSRRSVCRCSCTSTLMHGSTIAIGARQRVIVSTIFKTLWQPRWLIARSASTCATIFLILDRTSGALPLPTVQKVISPGVVHRATLTSMEPSCLLPLAAL